MSFTNYVGSGTTSGTVIYNVPTGKTAVLIGLNIANTSTSQETVSVMLDGVYILKDVPIALGSALSAIDGKIIAKSDQSISVISSTNNGVDVIISVLEE